VKAGLLDACTLDVAVIGNDDAAKVFVDAIPPAAMGTVVFSGSLMKWWWLLLLLVFILVGWLWFRKKATS